MDLFKLIFEHDLRLESLRDRHTDRDSQDLTLSIEEFMRPDPTYSRFYLSGTRLDGQRFGLNSLTNYDLIVERLQQALAGYRIHTENGELTSLSKAIAATPVGPAILFSHRATPNGDLEALKIDDDSNVGHRKEPLREALLQDELVLYKEKAHHGFDLHLFSKKNIYPDLFYPFRELIDKRFRFFSINGKRIQSERKFYFETWSLDRPPHGVEEVFVETVL